MNNNTRYYADDGSVEIEIDAESPSAAAQDYVDGGDWNVDSKTIWVTVYVIDADARDAYLNEASDDEPERSSHKIEIAPAEPACQDGGHDWRSPSFLHGLKENPGVVGHGGGVLVTECCMHCGCARITDTWAHDPSTGEQGLESVEYLPGEYADEVERFEQAQVLDHDE